MIPERLYLKGFAGIRAGLGRDELSLDLVQLAGDAELVAFAGPNGTGKTTVMDSLQPYRLLPSRASSFGPAGFSFYEHLVLPECVKELTWQHAGRRYRSTLVFRLNGRRKTEAYLHVEENGQWAPVKLPAGTLSDGRAETYDVCVEALLGKPETFFTSVFAAQNRRPLASYTPGEIKGLMVELLGLEAIRQAGEKASQVARLLKNTLDERRRVLGGLGDVDARSRILEETLARCGQEATQKTRDKAAAQAQVDNAQAQVTQLVAEREAARGTEERRTALTTRRATVREATAKAVATLQQDREREAARLKKLTDELEEARALARQRLTTLAKRREEAKAVLEQKPAIVAAIERVGTMAEAESELRKGLDAAQTGHQAWEARTRALAVLRTKAEGLRRQAGDAALRAAGLKQRFGLSDAVPCRGTELQPRCQLLADAREAQVVLPSADAEVDRVRVTLDTVNAEIQVGEAILNELGDTATAVRAAQEELRTLIEQRRHVEALAALGANLEQADRRLAEYATTEEEIGASLHQAQERCRRETDEALRNIAAIDQRRKEQAENGQATIAVIDAELAGLPPGFDLDRLARGEAALQAIRVKVNDLDTALLRATKEEASLQTELVSARARCTEARQSRAVVTRIEGELGWWNLLGKALGNDGVIALCVDDAGPELARLTNDLLLACYGPRFTVSIHTQVETARKELREGFDVVVFDAETGQAKSVGVMSGGERIWINEALTRAIALYLARTSGRHYETLFCDEADGPLDHERKRMFMQMKREVLRLGGYAREYFVSQTPELTQMADVVIDLGAFVRSTTASAAQAVA
jgi:DNA repair protein SbcC/Rad50